MPDDHEDRLQDDAEPAGHAVPDARRPRAARARLGRGVAGERSVYEAIRAACEGPPALRPARRPAVRERRHPHRPRGQQDPEGHRRQEPARMAGFDAPYVPGWDCHGMPIEVQIEKTHGKHLPVAETQRLCRAYATEQIARQKRALPAPGRARRLGPSVHDDGLQERGRRDPHARQAAGEGLPLSRPEARQLVLRLRQRARRSRGRVRGPRRHRDRRRLPARRRASARKLARGVRPARAARRPGRSR